VIVTIQKIEVEFGDPLINANYEYYLNNFQLLEKKIMTNVRSKEGK
jgi:hypothetical protein